MKTDHCAISSEKDSVALTLRRKLHSHVGLSRVGFEANGKLAIRAVQASIRLRISNLVECCWLRYWIGRTHSPVRARRSRVSSHVYDQEGGNDDECQRWHDEMPLNEMGSRMHNLFSCNGYVRSSFGAVAIASGWTHSHG